MSTLSSKGNSGNILFGKTRLAILSLLFGHPQESYYLRQVVRLTNAGLGSVQRELKQLTDARIIQRSLQGRRVYYRANQESPVFKELKSLVSRSTGKITVAEAVSPYTAAVPDKSMILRHIATSKRKLAAFCQRHYIRKLALFGSILHKDFSSDSDVDVLVEFEPSHVPGLAFFKMQEELAELFGRKVDLNTVEDLSSYFRDRVVEEMKVLYVET